MNTSLSLARAVADAVLYEGYLLYPYRASSQKNRTRWQFGILGPPGATAAGVGEETGMFADTLLRVGPQATLEVHLRFLQLQSRTVEIAEDGAFTPVPQLTIGDAQWLSWDEAAEQEVTLGPFTAAQLIQGQSVVVEVPESLDIELISDEPGQTAARLVRHRRALHGLVWLSAVELESPAAGLLRVRAGAENTAAGLTENKQDAIALSFIGAHMLLAVRDGDFISLLDPPDDARAAADSCEQYRCWPVLAGPEGQLDVLLLSPIILYDHPAVAQESSVALFDSTEIDEILTLRILTLTDEEKAEARATDPRAAAIIDRCEAMTPEQMQKLHGVLRNPHALDGTGSDQIFADEVSAANGSLASGPTGEPRVAGAPRPDIPWWTPEADKSVRPDLDVVMIRGIPIARGSMVTVNPQRRADAQDIFFAGRVARVTSVHFDVDGSTHVGLVLEDDPASDLHDWYGRSFYFAPDELVPCESVSGSNER